MTVHREAQIHIELTEHHYGKEPEIIMAKTLKPPGQRDHGKVVGFVTYRCGTRFSENFHSVTCEVEVTLPVGLDAAHGEDDYDRSAVRSALKEAVMIAEETYGKQAATLQKALHRIAGKK